MKIGVVLQIIEESGLSGVKHLYGLTWPQIIEHIKQHYGIQLVGSGAYGQVFIHPSWNYVIKIYESDPGYDRFLNICSSMKTPHLPKVIKPPKTIHQFHLRLKEAGSKLNIVKLEILSPLSIDFKNSLRQVKGGYSNKKIAHLYSLFKTHQKDAVYNELNSKYDLDSLFQTLQIIENNISTDHDFLDIHDGNFMMRGNTIVIVDPISNLYTAEPWYRYADYPIWISSDTPAVMKSGTEKINTPKSDDGIWSKLGKLLKGF